jgi:hypothetical protein
MFFMNFNRGGFLPLSAIPFGPGVFILIKYVKRLIAYLGEFRAPAGSSFDGAIVLNDPDDKHFIGIIDLMPDALQNFFEQRTRGVTAVHQFGNITEADITFLKFFGCQTVDPSRAFNLMPFEGEIDFLDSGLFRLQAKLSLSTIDSSTVKNAIFVFHIIVFLVS